MREPEAAAAVVGGAVVVVGPADPDGTPAAGSPRPWSAGTSMAAGGSVGGGVVVVCRAAGCSGGGGGGGGDSGGCGDGGCGRITCEGGCWSPREAEGPVDAARLVCSLSILSAGGVAAAHRSRIDVVWCGWCCCCCWAGEIAGEFVGFCGLRALCGRVGVRITLTIPLALSVSHARWVFVAQIHKNTHTHTHTAPVSKVVKN